MPKRLLIIFAFLGAIVCLPSFSKAQVEEQLTPNIVNSLRKDVAVQTNATYNVVETFNLLGLYETDDFNWILSGKNISQLKIKRNEVLLKRSQYGIKRTQNQTLISRLQTEEYANSFEISYQVNRAITQNNDWSEWRFEVIPSSMFIGSVDMAVTVPESVDASQVGAKVYAIHGVEDALVSLEDSKTISFTGSNMGPFSSFTSVVEFPKGTFKFSIIEIFWNWFTSLSKLFWVAISILMPILTFVVLSILIINRRRIEQIRPVAYPVQEMPGNISPSALGVLYHEKITEREIAAMILDLARRGYIYLIDKGGFYNFGRRRQPIGLRDYEKVLYDELLRGHLSSSEAVIAEKGVQELFSDTINQIYINCYYEVAGLGFFVENPRKVHLRFKFIGIGLFFAGLILFIASAYFLSELPALLFGFLGVSLASLVIIRMAGHLSLRTARGTENLNRWMAFREYLRNYQAVSQHKEINENIFLQYLPYAIVLGAEKEWAGYFANAPFVIPDWYITARDQMTLVDFANSIYPMLEYIAKIMASLKEPSID